MNHGVDLSQIEALLKAAKDITNHDEYVIIGSLSILGINTEQLPAEMKKSVDVDLYIKNDPNRTPELNNALGEGSDFDIANGYYADPCSPGLASLPEGWEDRLIEYNFGEVKAFFLDPNDAAVSKYIRGGERDHKWIQAGLKAGLLKMDIIERRIGSAPTLEGELEAARKQMAQDRQDLGLRVSRGRER